MSLSPLLSWRPRDHLQHAPNGVWIPGGDLEEIYVYPSSHATWPSESKVSYKAKEIYCKTLACTREAEAVRSF